MPFQANWFEKDSRNRPGSSTKAVWDRRLKGMKIETYLELGVHEGRSMLWILENLQPQRCVGVDHWTSRRRHERKQAILAWENVQQNLKPYLDVRRVVLHKMRTLQYFTLVMQQQVQPQFDLVYVDAGHDGRDAYLDMALSWELLRPGGLMVVDDMQRVWHRSTPLVFFAVQCFELLYYARADREWKDGRQIAFSKRKRDRRE